VDRDPVARHELGGRIVKSKVIICSLGVLLWTLVLVIPQAGAATKSNKSGPKVGGTVTIGEYSPVLTLNPIASDTQSGELTNLYGNLIYYNSKTKKYNFDLADGLDHNSSDTMWTLHIRPNVVFSNGQPFNAAAVVAALDEELNPAVHSPAYGQLANYVDSITAPSNLDVVFTLKLPVADFEWLLSYYASYIPAPAYLKEVAAGDTTAAPIGAGPFKFSSLVPESSVTLVRNTSYWQGAPYLNSVKYEYIAGGTATLQAYNAGELQGGLVIDWPSIHAVSEDHIPHYAYVEDLGYTLLMNNRSYGTPGGSILSDVELRKAIAMAINQPIYNQRLNQGYGTNTNVMFPPSSAWYDPKLKGVPYDPAEAKKLVAQVETAMHWNGSLNVDCDSSPSYAAFGATIESMLNPLGIHVNLTTSLNQGQFIDNVIVNKTYDLACWGAGIPDVAPTVDLYSNLYSTSFDNYGAYSSPAMDQALTSLVAAKTSSDVKADLAKIQEVFNTTVPYANVGQNEYVGFYSPKLHGVSEDGIGTLGLAKAWMS